MTCSRATIGASVILALASGSLCRGEDVAILWDISKSVPKEIYSIFVLQSVRDLVLGKGLAPGWKVTTPLSSHQLLTDSIAGRAAIARTGDRVLVVRFGSLDRTQAANLPFPNTEFTVSEASEIGSRLLAAFPRQATDDWTNKFLAEAAASRHLYDLGSKNWVVLMISDFNEDNRETLLPNEVDFVDSYDAQRFATVTPPTVVRLDANPRVIMKIRHAVSNGTVTGKPLPNLAPHSPLELIAPANNATIDAGRPIAFSWRWTGSAPVDSYRLVVSRLDPPTGTPVSRSLQATAFTQDGGLDAGRYRWQVFALSKDSTVSSRAVTFTVADGGYARLLFLTLLLLGALALVLLHFNRRRKERGPK